MVGKNIYCLSFSKHSIRKRTIRRVRKLHMVLMGSFQKRELDLSSHYVMNNVFQV